MLLMKFFQRRQFKLGMTELGKMKTVRIDFRCWIIVLVLGSMLSGCATPSSYSGKGQGAGAGYASLTASPGGLESGNVLKSAISATTRKALSSETLFELAEEAEKAYAQNRWLHAAQSYQRLTQLVPEDPYPWFRLGNTRAQQGLYQSAIDAYRQSLQRDPSQPKPWHNMATAQLLHARHSLRESVRVMHPQDPMRAQSERRLQLLDSLVYHRIEDVDS